MKWQLRNNKLHTVKDIWLNNLGVNTINDVNAWYKKNIEDSYFINNLDQAKNLIDKHKDGQITVIGDYDVDGVHATTIMIRGLKAYGCKNVSYRIPKRFSEGYGLNKSIIDEINSGLIITVDNGISALDSITYAKEKGLDVLLTDHHLPRKEKEKIILPKADVIIDAHAVKDQMDFKYYCGAGVAYKIIKYILKDKIHNNNDNNALKRLLLNLMILAGIATVADVMPLREENHVFVKRTIDYINQGYGFEGIKALCQVMNVIKLTSKDIGFKIAPCINACSRIYDNGASDFAMKLLLEDDKNKALMYAEEIKQINEIRKELKKKYNELAESLVDDNKNTPIVIKMDDCPEGIIGIIAGSLVEKYKRPAFVLTENLNNKETYKGSARGVNNYHIKVNLDKISSLIKEYGGHEGAAGFTVTKNNYECFKKSLIQNSDSFECDENNYYDLEIDVNDVSNYINEIEKLEPFGEGCNPIIFRINNFECLPINGKFYSKIGNSVVGTKFFNSKVIAISFNDIEESRLLNLNELNLYGEIAYYRYFDNNNIRFKPQVQYIDFENIEFKRKPTALAGLLNQKSAG